MRRALRYSGSLLAVILGICVIGTSVAARTPGTNTRFGSSLVQAAAESKTSIDAAVAFRASESNLQAIGVNRLRSQAGVSGLGQLIAVVDTGVDPRVFGGPNATAPDRVVDWIDLTNEGTTTPLGAYAAESGVIHVGEIPLNVASIRSRSGKYLVGVLPSTLTSALGSSRQAYFVVTDPDAAGLYNTVTVDTDSDLSLNNDASLREFRSSRSYAVLKLSHEQSIGLVVSRLDTKTGKVSFGFDLNGHGTGMAALASGSEVLPGAAPEARVVIIKALASNGLGDWHDIERGVEEAIAVEATVVLVGSARHEFGEDPEWMQMQSRLASMMSHLVLPVGNAGPGAGTITVSADSDATVLVSGYLPQATANALLGGGFSADVWYPMSSCGPDPEGNRGPAFSAPAIAAVPAFRGNGDLAFILMEGTSVSAAYAGGALALLRQTQTDAGGTLAKALPFVTHALAQGASKMFGVLPVEQGSGRLEVAAAWEILRSRPDHRRLLFVGDWGNSSTANGIWIKGTTPGAFPAWIDNYAPVARVVDLSTEAFWLRMRSERVLMEPVSQRETIIYGSGELSPGFYSEEITADDAATAGVDASFAVTVSVFHQFDASGKASFGMATGSSATVARQFIRVPQSAESLLLTVSGVAQGGHFAIYSPEGILVRQGSLDGAVVTRVGIPTAGIWQICVFGLNGNSPTVPARVEASLEGFFAVSLGATLHSQYYLVRSPRTKATIRGASADYASEWRHRSSFTQQTGRSTQLMLPDISTPVDALSVRFGTVTGNVLRAYLMHFDSATTRWSEVGRALTTSSGVGEIHLPNPTLGKYAVHTEAYGGGGQVYVEMDVNLLNSGGHDALTGVVPPSLTEGTTTLEIPLRSDSREPSLMVILRQSDLKVMGVLERPLVNVDDIPIVQISGGPDLRTIRAWQREGMKPVDVVVTVGSISYQLSEGFVTGPIPDGAYPSLITKQGSRILLVPQDQ